MAKLHFSAMVAGNPAQESRLFERMARNSRAVDLSIACLLGVGVGLRLYHYLARRSLWIDEARLALNIGARGYAELFRPLDYDQAAPPLFLLLEKIASWALGMNELSLRLLPFVGGLALLFLILPIARRVLPPVEVVVLLGIAAIAPVLVYYSNELKPYAVDAAVTLVLLTLTRAAAETPSWSRAFALAAAGATAIWLSTPAVFVLSGIALSWLLFGHSRYHQYSYAVMVGMVWAASFAVAYAFVYRMTAANPYLREFWRYRLLDLSQPELASRIWFALREAVVGLLAGTASGRELSAFWGYVSHGFTALALLLIVAGASRVRQRAGTFEASLLLSPLLMMLAASAAGYFPVALRLTLFGSPLVLLLVVAGAGGFVEALSKPIRPIVVIALLSTLGFLPYFTLLGVVDPTGRENARPLIHELQRRIQPDEAVFVDAGSLPTWLFYTTNWAAPDEIRLALGARIATSGGQAFENSAPRGRPVGNEGDSLEYRGPLGPEIFGLFTGMQWRWGRGLVQPLPDSGWAANEARRMMARPQKSWWAIFTHDFGSSSILRRAFECVGAEQVFVDERGLVQLVKYRRK